MIGKILLTLAVTALACLIVRRGPKGKSNKSKRTSAKTINVFQRKSSGLEMHDDMRLASYLFLLFMVIVGSSLYYFRWLDDHQLVTVRLYSTDQAEPASFEVYKYHLADRSFTTIDGRVVTVAGSERMEIIGLND